MTNLNKADALEAAFFAEIASLEAAGQVERAEAIRNALAALPLASAAAIFDAVRA